MKFDPTVPPPNFSKMEARDIAEWCAELFRYAKKNNHRSLQIIRHVSKNFDCEEHAGIGILIVSRKEPNDVTPDEGALLSNAGLALALMDNRDEFDTLLKHANQLEALLLREDVSMKKDVLEAVAAFRNYLKSISK